MLNQRSPTKMEVLHIDADVQVLELHPRSAVNDDEKLTISATNPVLCVQTSSAARSIGSYSSSLDRTSDPYSSAELDDDEDKNTPRVPSAWRVRETQAPELAVTAMPYRKLHSKTLHPQRHDSARFPGSRGPARFRSARAIFPKKFSGFNTLPPHFMQAGGTVGSSSIVTLMRPPNAAIAAFYQQHQYREPSAVDSGEGSHEQELQQNAQLQVSVDVGSQFSPADTLRVRPQPDYVSISELGQMSALAQRPVPGAVFPVHYPFPGQDPQQSGSDTSTSSSVKLRPNCDAVCCNGNFIVLWIILAVVLVGAVVGIAVGFARRNVLS